MPKLKGEVERLPWDEELLKKLNHLARVEKFNLKMNVLMFWNGGVLSMEDKIKYLKEFGYGR